MLALTLLAACAGSPEPVVGPVVITGATVVGRGPAEIRFEDGTIVAVGAPGEVDRTGATVFDHAGSTIVPAFVDAHVHLAYLPMGAEMLDGGVAAMVDWASPLDWLDGDPGAIQLAASGPMITAVGGYPTQSWGQDGFGAECSDGPTCIARVDAAVAKGAKVVKIPVTSGPTLDDAAITAVVENAHGRGLLVGTHAMTEDEVARAGRLGIDILVHTPTAPLTDATVALWADRTVISTLDAFGGSTSAVENLRRLRAAGATVLYGTDFGNSRSPGIQRRELEALVSAGLDGAAILEAGTTAPAARFGFQLGIEPGKPASMLILEDDPTTSPTTLASPREVWIAGQRR